MSIVSKKMKDSFVRLFSFESPNSVTKAAPPIAQKGSIIFTTVLSIQ